MKMKNLTYVLYLLSFLIVKNVFAYNEVKIEGLFRYSQDAVLENLKFKDKKNITSEDLSNEIKNLYSLGFFSDVSLNYENNILIVKVREVPVIADIKFNGLKALKKELILPELLSYSRGFYSKASVVADANKIETAYKSFGIVDASVEPMIEFLDGGKVYIVFDINEGKARKINKIFFNGNKEFSDYTLKENLLIKEKSIFRIFSSSTKYNVANALSAIERLPIFYKQRGFLNAKIDYQITTINDDDTVDINIYIEEGEKFKFKDYKIINNLPDFEIKDQESLVKFKSGKIFNVDLVSLTQYEINSLLQQDGFVLSKINIEYIQDQENNTVDVIFTINPSPRIFINQIQIRGNSKTNDNVIRREFTFSEGDLYNALEVSQSIQNLRASTYFDRVDIIEEQVDQDKVNLIVTVVEGRTVSANIQFGYDFGSNVSATLGWQESNFRGTGISTSISVQKARYNEDISFSIYNPYFLGRDLGLSSSTGYSNNYNLEVQDYKNKSGYQSLGISYALTKNVKQSLNYSIRYDKLTLSGSQLNASPLLLERNGEYFTSKIGQTLSYSRRDKGFFASISQYVAGIGGNVAFFQNDIRIEQSLPLFSIDNSVLSLKLKVSNIVGLGQPVSIRDRFSIGGNSGLRGFDSGGVSPVLFYKIKGSEVFQETSYGGKNLIAGSVEYSFPNFIPKELGLRTFVFFDFGTVFSYDSPQDTSFNGEYYVKHSNKLRTAIGAGLSISTPLGEISAFYGKALSYESFDSRKSFFIGIGGMYF